MELAVLIHPFVGLGGGVKAWGSVVFAGVEDLVKFLHGDWVEVDVVGACDGGGGSKIFSGGRGPMFSREILCKGFSLVKYADYFTFCIL